MFTTAIDDDAGISGMVTGERIPCPICGSSAGFSYSHPEAPIYRCGDCRHAFTGVENLDTLETYDPAYYDEAHENWFQNPNFSLFRWIAERIAPDAKSVIDVGCGRGDFLRYLKGHRPGLDLCGVDLSRNDDEAGIEFIHGDILAAPLGRRFDVVVSLGTIEHIPDVFGFASRLSELCAPGGQVVVMTINDGGVVYMAARLAKRFGITIAFDRLYSSHHLHHFTASSFRRLFERTGFDVRTTHFHNYPLAAVDIPVKNKLVRRLLLAAVGVLHLLGDVIDKQTLQTLVATPRDSASGPVGPRRTGK